MQQARRSERDFTRERALPLQQLVPLLLNFRKGTNRDELEQFFETITDDPTSVTPVSEAAFCRARQMHRHGYRLLSAGVMDMFPHTAHVESIALFEKGGK